MKGNQFAFVAVVIGCLFVAEARAQSFFQRLTDQLNQQLAPPANQPNTNNTDTLPAPRELAPSNAASRASLGIRVGPVTEELMREQRLVVRRGAVINQIELGSAADRAGLPVGAVIVAFGGRRIDTPEDLVDAVRRARAGQDVELTYYDREKLARKMVHLAAATGPEAAIPSEPAVRPNQPTPTPIPGSIPGPVPGPAPAPGASNLERQLGAGGSRPLLGRLGRAINNFAAEAQAVTPVNPAEGPRVDLEAEVGELRQQVASLAKEIDALRQQVTSLEKKLSDNTK